MNSSTGETIDYHLIVGRRVLGTAFSKFFESWIDNSKGRLLLSERELEWQGFAGTRDWKAYPPTLREVKAWRASMTRMAESYITVSLTGPCFIRLHHMSEAEDRYQAMGLL